MLKITISKNDCDKDRIVALGNFDGIHLGHLKLISELNKIAEQKQYLRALILFFPLTHEYLHGYEQKPRISLLRDNIEFLQTQNLVDEVFLIHFNSSISKMSGEEFTDKILIEKLHVKHMVIGHDFSYGYNRSGTLETLQKFKISTSIIEPLYLDNKIISSSLIRQLILNKEFNDVIKYLGHPLSLTGRVVYGNQLGKTAALPTINISLNKIVPALQGVFLSHVYIDNKKYNAISNIGTKPTVTDARSYNIETHLLNATVNCYNKIARVEFIEYIRPEKKFSNKDDMFTQIRIDVSYAIEYFSNAKEQS